MKKKARGPDGWCAGAFLELPQAGLDRLAQLLPFIEAEATWPEALCHWRVVFLAKESSGSLAATDVLKTRPVSVGPIVFRL